jgi:hypothetical protein
MSTLLPTLSIATLLPGGDHSLNLRDGTTAATGTQAVDSIERRIRGAPFPRKVVIIDIVTAEIDVVPDHFSRK